MKYMLLICVDPDVQSTSSGPTIDEWVAEVEGKRLDGSAFHSPKDATTVIVSWGSTKGALLDALDRLWADGTKIGYLHVRLIKPFPVAEVTKILAKAKRLIGVEVPAARVAEILGALGMTLTSTGEGWSVTPPSWRFDITQEADLVEEVALRRALGRDFAACELAPGTMQIWAVPSGSPSPTR